MDLAIGPAARRTSGLCAFLATSLALAGCQSSSSTHGGDDELAVLDQSPIFSEAEYGVAASPRVTDLKRVPRGGGREQVGKPYQVRGKWYYPKEEPGYVRSGKASWYGSNFHGRLTANGEIYDMYHLSAAHPTFPLPSYARVTNEANGHSIMVRVNDRGPYAHGRVVDLSERAAEVLDFKNDGVADVKVEYVGRAPLEGDDGPMLMASFRPGGASPINDGLPSGVMIASNDSPAQTLASFNGSTPLPGVRQIGASSAISDGLAPRQPATGSLYPVSDVPMPTLRDFSLSYAPAQAQTGAFKALAELSETRGPAREEIAIGPVEDLDLLLRIHAVAETRGTLVEAGAGEGAGLSLVVSAGVETDDALRALWNAGVSDAFVLRD
ncbi:septal ring lytic transglycosylase RlpA family protein [Aureimonas mangrovi]|uniref:septal ring lytic transglycosylase RlpA family protein n=1 Tax=Aureimonas mangrovi TaxID=2758041 RepID=UPI00163DBDB3|nr:septal ring lytic transglycosylase RlpA family protein [Aureimonas mangrovi]